MPLRQLVALLLCCSPTVLLLTGCAAGPRPSPPDSSAVRPTSTPGDPVVHDLGSRPFAEGPVEALPPIVVRAGGPPQPRFAYTIVRGDTIRGIASRFEMCLQDFHDFNPDAVDLDLRIGRQVTIARSTLEPFSTSCLSRT